MEIQQITTSELIRQIQGIPLGSAIQQIKNTGNIQDSKLRRRWVAAKRAIERVEKYLQSGGDNEQGD